MVGSWPAVAAGDAPLHGADSVDCYPITDDSQRKYVIMASTKLLIVSVQLCGSLE